LGEEELCGLQQTRFIPLEGELGRKSEGGGGKTSTWGDLNLFEKAGKPSQ